MITKKELQNQINNLRNVLNRQGYRWEILKEYLGVEEEECPELKKIYSILFGFETIPVKKTRLVKIKNKK